jgi:hypothetical protein
MLANRTTAAAPRHPIAISLGWPVRFSACRLNAIRRRGDDRLGLNLREGILRDIGLRLLMLIINRALGK